MAQGAAQTTARKVKETAAAVEDALDRDEADRVSRQMADLQADVARLLQGLADLGLAKGEAVADAVRAGADRLKAGKDAAAARVDDQLAEARDYVQANPVKALGFAALAGLVFGLLLGRR